MENTDKVSTVIGIISYGPKVCGHEPQPKVPTVFTSIGSVAEWIVKLIQPGECAKFELGETDPELASRVKEEKRRRKEGSLIHVLENPK